MGGEDRTTKYVIGLGNPGRRYRHTRHNVGFLVLAELRRRWDFGRGRRKFHSRVWTGRIADAAVTLLAPETYVNRSGQAVAEALAFTKARSTDALVVLDDMALPVGQLRVRAKGSAGGHKGLDDILRLLPDEALPRLRIGIGRPPEPMDAVDYVLTTFGDEEQAVMGQALARAADAVADWATRGIAYVMNRYNARDVDPPAEDAQTT